MVESAEFPHLANKYAVMSVPKAVIKETSSFEGALPEKQFAEWVIKAVHARWPSPAERSAEINVPMGGGIADGIFVRRAAKASVPRFAGR